MVLNAVKSALRAYDSFSYDTDSISQEKLNLANKSRTSLFRWRGQFSPELVEHFLDAFAHDGDVVLDPFVGSGTVLFESARKGLTSYAAEINPSAVEMASTAHFVSVGPERRAEAINRAKSLVENKISRRTWPLLSQQTYREPTSTETTVETVMGKLVQQLPDNSLTRNVLANALIRFMGYRKPDGALDILRAVNEHAEIVMDLPYGDKPARVFHIDARTIPLVDGTVNLVITSPPYINVFNYHQNNRPAMESMGWDLLKIAHSEFGSNRKNRQNRFLTVVQYCLDMLDILHEIRRLLASNGRAIIVVGRESSVRGVSFKNGRIVAALAMGAAGFKLERLQQRAFKNKFGDIIYEDILHLVPMVNGTTHGDYFASSLAQEILDESTHTAEGEVRQEITDAKNRVSQVAKSPIFRLSSHRPVAEAGP